MRRLFLLLALLSCKPAGTVTAATDAGPAEISASDSKALLAMVDRLKDQLKDRPKTFEILTALGNLYYENGRFLEAVGAYREALELARPAEATLDSLRRRQVKPDGELPPECRRSGPEYGLAQIAAAAQKLPPPKQVRCLEGVLEMATAAHARRGNALYLIGNPASALAEHRAVLERTKDYPESLFFVGAILLEQSQGDKAKLEEGKRYWKRLLAVAPDHPRAALVREKLPKADEIFRPRTAGSAQATMPPGHPPVGGDQLPPGHPTVAHSQGSLPAGLKKLR